MQMQSKSQDSLPGIILGDADHSALIEMAEAMGGPLTTAAERLLLELDRATIVPQKQMSADHVSMGSTVTFETSSKETRTFQLVMPADANVEAQRVSVLTPIGTALIGLKIGQSIPWHSRDGKMQTLRVTGIARAARS